MLISFNVIAFRLKVLKYNLIYTLGRKTQRRYLVIYSCFVVRAYSGVVVDMR